MYEYEGDSSLPAQESMLLREIMQVRESLEKLQALTDQLRDRLGVVLLPNEPTAKESAVLRTNSAPERRSTTVRTALADVGQTVEGISSKLARLLQDVEV